MSMTRFVLSNLVIFEQLGPLELESWGDQVLVYAEWHWLQVNGPQHLEPSQLHGTRS